MLWAETKQMEGRTFLKNSTVNTMRHKQTHTAVLPCSAKIPQSLPKEIAESTRATDYYPQDI